MTDVVNAAPVFRNRRSWLIFFGVGLVVLGLMTLCMAGLVMFGAIVAQSSDVPGAMPMRMMVPAALFYVALGIGFGVLGVGSAMSRRWAQATILAVAWMWLLVGLLTTVMMAFMMPRMLASMPAESAEARPFIVGCMIIIVALFFILLPGVLVLFYRGPNVRATVEVLDPVRRWTDDTPLPLLAFVLWMLLGAFCVLLWSFAYRVIPLGPWMIRGWAAPVVMVVLAAVLTFIGLGSIRRARGAWWLSLALFVMGAVYTVALLRNMNVQGWYDEMELPADPAQIQMMQDMYGSPMSLGIAAVLWVVYFAFLFYLRRYFYPTERTTS